MKKSELRQIIREEIQNLNRGDTELSTLKKERSKYNKNDIRYKELSKKIGDLESDKEYGLPGSKAHDKFSIDEQSYVTNNQYVESKIIRMIKSFSKQMDITPWEAHNLVRDTVDKLTDSFGEGGFD